MSYQSSVFAPFDRKRCNMLTNTLLFSGDKPLNEALKLMDNEGISSLAVVDNGHNVIGNISTVDVKVRLSIYKNPKLELSD